MKKIHLGLLLGIIAGILDVIPMILQGLTWDANLSAFFFWIIAGFFIATSSLKLKGSLKGIVLSLLLLIPVAFLIAWQEPISLVPIIIFNIVLGALLGYLIDRYGLKELK